MKNTKDKNSEETPGYPLYPETEDIYYNAKEEADIDPEKIERLKSPNSFNGSNENNFDNLTRIDLDVPGSELDDEQENIGSEDEENNYYSLGGNNHRD